MKISVVAIGRNSTNTADTLETGWYHRSLVHLYYQTFASQIITSSWMCQFQSMHRTWSCQPLRAELRRRIRVALSSTTSPPAQTTRWAVLRRTSFAYWGSYLEGVPGVGFAASTQCNKLNSELYCLALFMSLHAVSHPRAWEEADVRLCLYIDSPSIPSLWGPYREKAG